MFVLSSCPSFGSPALSSRTPFQISWNAFNQRTASKVYSNKMSLAALAIRNQRKKKQPDTPPVTTPTLGFRQGSIGTQSKPEFGQSALNLRRLFSEDLTEVDPQRVPPFLNLLNHLSFHCPHRYFKSFFPCVERARISKSQNWPFQLPAISSLSLLSSFTRCF